MTTEGLQDERGALTLYFREHLPSLNRHPGKHDAGETGESVKEVDEVKSRVLTNFALRCHARYSEGSRDGEAVDTLTVAGGPNASTARVEGCCHIDALVSSGGKTTRCLARGAEEEVAPELLIDDDDRLLCSSCADGGVGRGRGEGGRSHAGGSGDDGGGDDGGRGSGRGSEDTTGGGVCPEADLGGGDGGLEGSNGGLGRSLGRGGSISLRSGDNALSILL